MTSWRRSDARGVLMPMRLDVQVDRTGRSSQVTMNDVPDQTVAKPRVSREAALAAVLGPEQGRASGTPSAVLLAAQHGSAWVPAWFVEVDENHTYTSGYVDALTGEEFEPEQ
ncbi:hypothetical protein AB0G79_04635 [Streptomyces sp. NPDC020807]|uniref:hypothetical protein n=1 Tax=Streptomyces sp. NPDC020807 TaxID=3155119 RepID=UPI0033EBEFEF